MIEIRYSEQVNIEAEQRLAKKIKDFITKILQIECDVVVVR